MIGIKATGNPLLGGNKVKARVKFALLSVLCFSTPGALGFHPSETSDHPLDNWELRPPLSGAITFQNGEFWLKSYGPSYSENLFSSSDGGSWIQHHTDTNDYFSYGTHFKGPLPAYGNGRYVTYDYGERHYIPEMSGGLVSTNGRDWQFYADTEIPFGIRGIAFGAGQFVAVGQKLIISTEDGISWRTNSATDYTLSGIAFLGGQFVASAYQEEGETVAHYVALSPDGNEWSFHPLPQNNFAAGTVQWAYGNGRYVGAVFGPFDYDGPDELMPGRIFVFSDPSEIHYLSNGPVVTTIVFGEDKFVAGSILAGIQTSEDGLNWTRRSDFPTAQLSYGNGLYIATWGESMATSTNGVDWRDKIPPLIDMPAIAYGNGAFLASSVSSTTGPTVLMSSTNGNNWNVLSSDRIDRVTEILFSNGRFLALQTGGRGRSSSDLQAWTEFETQLPGDPTGLAEFQGGYLAVSSSNRVSGHISQSADGLNWDLRASLESLPILGIAANARTAVAISNVGKAAVSVDGVSWTEVPLPTRTTSIAYGAGRFVATGSGVATSVDGVTWEFQERPAGFGGDIKCVIYRAGRFFAGTSSALSVPSVVLESTDGLNWTPHYAHPFVPSAIEFGANSLLMVGNPRVYQQSGTFTAEPVIHVVPLAAGIVRVSAYNPHEGEAFIEWSTDLIHWTSLVSGRSSVLEVEEGEGAEQRFYRLQVPVTQAP